MATLRSAMFDAVTEEDIRDMVKNLMAKAKEGDKESLKMVFEYVLGGRNAPTSMTQNNIVITPEPPDPAPTCARAGTRDKISVLSARRDRGEGLFHNGDGAEAG